MKKKDYKNQLNQFTKNLKNDINKKDKFYNFAIEFYKIKKSQKNCINVTSLLLVNNFRYDFIEEKAQKVICTKQAKYA